MDKKTEIKSEGQIGLKTTTVRHDCTEATAITESCGIADEATQVNKLSNGRKWGELVADVTVNKYHFMFLYIYKLYITKL